MVGQGIPRAHYDIYKEDREVGEVTSGIFSPTLKKGIGLGYVMIEEAREGNEITIVIRQKRTPARIVKVPFYKRPLIHRFKIGKGEYNYEIAG